MEFTKCPEMPKITLSAYKRFTSYDDDRKAEKLKEYVEAYFSLVEDGSCTLTPNDVEGFKEKFELLEKVKLADFQNAYNFVFLKLKNHYYEKKRTNFSIQLKA
uniref:RGS domain-containing protein n=1 Tax=Strongyloides stercoralis TaxID=6248 RepID=A0A0K0E3F3_STRER